MTCPKCGTELPPDAPAGICPRCLMQAALNFQEDSGAESIDGAYAVTTPQPGNFLAPEPHLLAAHFPQLELGELLGQGGMGAVYKARQRKLDRQVALKIIRPESASDSAFAERFNREARTLARLSHPQIVGVHDFGEVKIPDPADPSAPPVTLYYFLMEYVDGANLRQLIQAGELDSELTLSVISQICDALQFAHDEGIVHRDIKPENVLLDRKGRVKIADFGLAKLASRSEQDFTLTGTHQVMGTPRYMAPEQMAGSRAVDHRADLYSLGVVFYEMLTGEIPAGHFSPPSQHAAIDGRLDKVVMKALAQKPDDRFQSASEIRASLEAVSRGESESMISEPEQAPARGFSTIFEREIGAAWNWVVHPEKKSDGASNKNEAAAFPLLLFLTLSLLGGLTMLLPWAELQMNPGATVTFIDDSATLIEPVSESYSGTDNVVSMAVAGSCFLVGFVLLLSPSRWSPGWIVVGLMTILSLAAVFAIPVYYNDLIMSDSFELQVDVSEQAAQTLRSVGDSGDGHIDPEAEAKRKAITERVNLRNLQDHLTFREGFYAALGISLTLVVLNFIAIRNAILNREPKPKMAESWSGTPLASLRFAVPTQGDIGAKVRFHFAGLGYELVDEQPGAWIFQRGSAKGLLFWGTNLLTLPTRLSVYAIDDENGGHLVNCHWSVRLGGGFATSNESRKLEDEGRQLQALLGGQIDNPADTSVSTVSFGNQADCSDAPDVRPRDESRPVEDRAAIDLVAVEDEVSGPAIAMISIGILTILGNALWTAVILANAGRFYDEHQLSVFSGIMVGFAMIIGGLCLKNLGSRGWAQMCIIAAMLPIHFGWIITMPIGIWAQVMLRKPQTREAFLERARRRRQSASDAPANADFDLIDIEEEVSGPAIAMIAVGLLTLIGLAAADVMILSNRSDPLLVWLSIPGLLVGLGMLRGDAT